MAASLRALLFSDVEGSTALLDRLGVGYVELLNRHREIIRAASLEFGGREHGSEGDSLFVSFESPLSALAAAVAAQLGMAREVWPEGDAIRVRMGIHIGEVTEHDGEPFGVAVHHAARIAAAAHGGQVVVSEGSVLVLRALPDGVTLRPLGAHVVRDVGTVPLFQVAHEGLRDAFPPLRVRSSVRTNLPRPATVLVGGTERIRPLQSLLACGPTLRPLPSISRGSRKSRNVYGHLHS